MQFLVIFTPKPEFAAKGMAADFAQRRFEDEVREQEFYTAGALRQFWTLEPKGSGGVTLFEADSHAHFQEMVDSFPLVEANYVGCELIQLQPHAAFANQP